VDDLLDIARRVAAAATDGEAIEAFVARGRTTTVRAYEGEIEALVTADSFGIGVRVVRDGRQGFASA
jgi:PmbA protein